MYYRDLDGEKEGAIAMKREEGGERGGNRGREWWGDLPSCRHHT